MRVLLSLLVLFYLFMASGRCCSFKWTLNLPDNIRSRSTTLPDKEKGPSPPHKRTQHCWPTTPNIVGCYMLRPFAHHVPCCCVLLGVVVAQSLKPVKLLSQQLPTSPRVWTFYNLHARSYWVLWGHMAYDYEWSCFPPKVFEGVSLHNLWREGTVQC